MLQLHDKKEHTLIPSGIDGEFDIKKPATPDRQEAQKRRFLLALLCATSNTVGRWQRLIRGLRSPRHFSQNQKHNHTDHGRTGHDPFKIDPPIMIHP